MIYPPLCIGNKLKPVLIQQWEKRQVFLHETEATRVFKTMMRFAPCYRYPNIISLKLLHAFAAITSLPASSPVTSLDQSYTVTPPVKPWPQCLYPKRLVSMITRQQNLDLALQIFEYAGKYHPGFSHNYDTYDSIIHKLGRARAFQHMEVLLSDLQKAEIKCGEDLFINVIRNYGLSGKPDFALKTFIRIQDFKVQRSVRSLNTLLNAFVQNKRYDLVHAMFKSCRTSYGVIPNVFTCNILIKALCEKNDIEAAIKVFNEMPSMGMIPNVVTYTTILGGYVSRGDMVNAKKVFGDLFDRGWLPDATTYTILMNGYCQQGRLADAIKLMDSMEVEPNDVTYGVMIEAFCKEKKAGEASNLLDDMLEKKFIPSPALCCKVIDVLCGEGKVEEACELWKRMLKKNCTPDNATTSTLIHWLCKEGKIQEAKKLFDEFEQGSIPSLMTYNTLIAGMCEKGELSELGRLWDDMVEKGCKPNAFTYNMLIKGFTKVGNMKEGVGILKEMLEKGCMPNKLTYSLLIDELFKMGTDEVNKVIFMVMSNGGMDDDSWDLFLNRVVIKLDRGRDVFHRLLMNSA